MSKTLDDDALYPSSRPGEDRAFRIQVASTGEVISVLENQTVVAALIAVGIDLPTSCEQGICGTCLTGVLKGIPDHRDSFLTDDEKIENTQFLPCCSRALSAMLVLDL